MKLNKNGWGTIEMLLLSAGILIALLVATYYISKLYSSFDNVNNSYYKLESELAKASEKYISDNNISVNDTITIYSDTLEVLGYIDRLSDKNGYPCVGYTVINKENSKLNYKPYITCRDYKTNF